MVRGMTKTCKHCKTEIVYVEGLQRYNHVSNNYDSCNRTFDPNDPLAGKRAEPA